MQHLRTSEDERQRVLNYLRDCCAEGYLELDELDERQSRVLRSRTRGELAALVADMPGSAEVLPGAGQAPPTFVRQRGARVTATSVIAMLTLLAVMVLVSVPVFELLIFGGFVLALVVFGLVVFVSLSPWLAAGALVAWSVNRLRQRPAPHQLH